MGQDGSKEDFQQQAADIQAHQLNQAAQQQSQLLAFQELQRKQNEERAALRRREEERLDAADREFAEREKNVLEMARKTQEANRARTDQIQRDNEERVRAAIRDGNDALDKQRNINQSEITNKTLDHQNQLTRTQNRIAETEKNAEEKVIKLKEKNEQIQQKIHDESKHYHEKKLETSERHALELEKRHKETSEIMLEREANKLKHTERMAISQKMFEADRINIAIEGEKDVKESHFIDAVSNTKRCGLEVSSAINGMGKYAYALKKDKEAQPKDINALKVLLQQTVPNKIMHLEMSASSILDQQESANPNAVKCQQIAKEIKAAVSKLSKATTRFQASLGESPIDESPKLFKKVTKANDALQELVDSFPIVTRSHHAIGMIMQSTRSITSGNYNVEAIQSISTLTVSAIEDSGTNS
ncbi:hypothetical protein GCK72_019033 [Caenorhabditis remanei]|uniref:Protein containing ALS2cr12 (ALS2CR12) signature n=1 Tax=Caenorhabditis remanei TaxID=31234 RepID=A0A6A5GBJ6_CAERE|nr:hypothetical protein GCK72_019033 [Caenorhabditis remanei]KAF1752478.1 hypothetical protein GCK72_019033 [Caenorhabditis remanei]